MKKVHTVLALLIMLISCCSTGFAQSVAQDEMLVKINKVRIQGCNCSGKFMKPVAPLTWSSTLMTSALRHAKDMKRRQYFSHFSPDGNDIGDRLDDVGYVWSYCGENLGSGQKNFDEVLEDWIKSQSHCMMLMNPEVEEVAVANSGKYWVQHFGRRFRQDEVFGTN